MDNEKLILAILLTVISTSAMAEWTLVGSGNGYDAYVNLSTIRRIGNKVKVWTLTDYKKIQKEIDEQAYLSSSIQQGLDCEAETHSFLYIMRYSDNMGVGKVISSVGMSGMDYPIPPDSIGEALWKIACSNK